MINMDDEHRTRTRYINIHRNNMDSELKDKLIKIELELKKLNDELNKPFYEKSTQKFSDFISMIQNDINHKYHNYIIKIYDTNYILESDLIVQLYTLKIYNKQQQKLLENYNKQYGTDEELLGKLKALLKKKLELI
jgi:hypothetical protein